MNLVAYAIELSLRASIYVGVCTIQSAYILGVYTMDYLTRDTAATVASVQRVEVSTQTDGPGENPRPSAPPPDDSW